MTDDFTHLATYQHMSERIKANWPGFLDKRRERLAQQGRFGAAAEKVAENILEDLFTEVLDWTVADLNNQVGYADILLSQNGIKYVLIEAKRPGALTWHRRAVEQALDQALRYAGEQKVSCVAVSDGAMLYAANLVNGGLRDRLFVSLEQEKAPLALWWLSVNGIYRSCEAQVNPVAVLPAAPDGQGPITQTTGGVLLHPKYKIPVHCFAYAGNPAKTSTWKLPYRLLDGSVDTKRLPKAIQAILTNYRGTKVSSIPETAIPDVLVRLARAADAMGHMPYQGGPTAPVYEQLAEALVQLGRFDEVKRGNGG